MQLARELKINTLMRQRMFIKMKLEDSAPEIYGEEDISAIFDDVNKMCGDVSYTYIGYVYPENRSYFQSEGFQVTELHPQDGFSITRGRPVFLFTPSDTIKLSKKELEHSKEEIIEGEFLEKSETREKFLEQLYEFNKKGTMTSQPTDQN